MIADEARVECPMCHRFERIEPSFHDKFWYRPHSPDGDPNTQCRGNFMPVERTAMLETGETVYEAFYSLTPLTDRNR